MRTRYKLKMTNTLKLIMKRKSILNIFALFILLTSSIFIYKSMVKAQKEIKKEVTTLKRKLNTANQIIEYLEYQKDTLETLLGTSYNSAVVFEILVGVKEPNGIIEYKEKLMIASKNIHKLNRAKLKKNHVQINH